MDKVPALAGKLHFFAFILGWKDEIWTTLPDTKEQQPRKHKSILERLFHLFSGGGVLSWCFVLSWGSQVTSLTSANKDNQIVLTASCQKFVLPYSTVVSVLKENDWILCPCETEEAQKLQRKSQNVLSFDNIAYMDTDVVTAHLLNPLQYFMRPLQCCRFWCRPSIDPQTDCGERA